MVFGNGGEEVRIQGERGWSTMRVRVVSCLTPHGFQWAGCVAEFGDGWDFLFRESFFVMYRPMHSKSVGSGELQMTFRKQAEQLSVHNPIEPQESVREGSYAFRATHSS